MIPLLPTNGEVVSDRRGNMEGTYKGFADLEKMRTNWLIVKGSNTCAYRISGNRAWVMDLSSPSKDAQPSGVALNYLLANEFVLYKEDQYGY
ncbi:hypothetical protein MCCARTNEY_255 [Bacillus phage vB_BanH_McCartney]|nr:hypothetical protein MCCARTNEY_255 [Bacillus phage vB_BanH_McCartney]